MATIPEQIRELWEREIAIEPAPGAATTAQVDELRTILESLRGGAGPYRRQGQAVLDGLPPDERADMETLLARVLARAATVAYAAGDRETGFAWLSDACELSHDPELRAQLDAAKREPERYRMLVHGRYLFAHGREGAARKAWKRVAKGASKDALCAAAKDELAAPRPLKGTPSLYRINGIGTGFYGSRDHANDGSYVTTHCFSFVWVPVIPLRAFRVRRSGSGYTLLAREQLSGFARFARLAVVAGVVGTIAYGAISSYLHDPRRLARNRFDDVIAAAHGKDPEAALRRLDAELTGPDLVYVSPAVAQRAGAAVVELTASFVPKPFTSDSVEQAGRVVARYQQLPEVARGGAALDALLGELDGWTTAVAKDPRAQLALLRRESEVADSDHLAKIATRVSQARLAVAASLQADDPLAALAVLTEDPKDAAAMQQAGKVIASIADQPSLLDDAGDAIDTWLASPGRDAELAAKVAQERTKGQDGRAEAEADGVTRAQLEKMQRERPWDQRVALALARLDADAGKTDAAEARLRKLGPPGLLVRDARIELAQLAFARGDLASADQLASAVLETRLPGFTAASAALEAAVASVQDRLKSDFDSGILPRDLQDKLATASDDEQRAIVQKWVADQLDHDEAVGAARQHYLAYADVVPAAIFVGTVELRRAQAMSGAARDAMLDRAEKAFLAVRSEAEGQPEFHLGLGEIYARLGKNKESEAEFASVLGKHDPRLSFQVAQVYRGLGRIERAKEIAKQVYDTATSPQKENAAMLLGLIAEDSDLDESEGWYRRADQKDPNVQIALLELEGKRDQRAGKRAECERTFAEIARRYLAIAGAANLTAYNNASIADSNRFDCTGDMSALADAEAALQQAYKASGEQPIVVGNLASLMESDAIVRAIARRVDIRELRAGASEASTLADALLDSPERDALLADLAADPGWRKSAELAGHFEVLAPSNTSAYALELGRSLRLRDEASASAVLDRLHHAKALDTSETDEAYRKWVHGDDDAKRKSDATVAIAHFDEVLARGNLSPRTRAAALYLEADHLHTLGTFWNDPAAIVRAIAAREQAAQLWPALADQATLAMWAVDEAGVRADATRWSKLRHERGAAEVLDALVAAGDPLAAKIRSSAQWAEVAAHARAGTGRPHVDDLRLARLLGDAQVEARTKAVLDDPLERIELEVAVLMSPTQPSSREALAYLAKH